MNVYYGEFGCWNDVVREFSGTTYSDQTVIESVQSAWPEPEKVFYANYDIDGYEGNATVIWKNGSTYYFLSGGHCSCFGLEETGMTPDLYTKEELIHLLESFDSNYYLPLDLRDDLIEQVKNA